MITKEIAPLVAYAFSTEKNQRLCSWQQIYGCDTFWEGFIIAYQKIILEQQGDINCMNVQNDFLCYLHGVLEKMVSSEVCSKFEYALNVANKKFENCSGYNYSHAKRLLHDLLISCRSAGISEEDIVKRFMNLKNYAYVDNVTYDDWCNEVVINTPS